jgi:hypothetical protein
MILVDEIAGTATSIPARPSTGPWFAPIWVVVDKLTAYLLVFPRKSVGVDEGLGIA